MMFSAHSSHFRSIPSVPLQFLLLLWTPTVCQYLLLQPVRHTKKHPHPFLLIFLWGELTHQVQFVCENISSRKDILGCVAWKASWLFVLWGCFLTVEVKREVISPRPSSRIFCAREHMLKGNVAKALLTLRNIAVSLIAEVYIFFKAWVLRSLLRGCIYARSLLQWFVLVWLYCSSHCRGARSI